MSLQILVSYLLCSPKLAVFQALRNMYDVFPAFFLHLSANSEKRLHTLSKNNLDFSICFSLTSISYIAVN